MKVIVFDRNKDLLNEISKFNISNVEINHNLFENLKIETYKDGIVSPANSFGFMNGGIDQVYVNKYGKQLEDRVRERISRLDFGELLVGQAVSLSVTKEVYSPYLIAAPTMRVPFPITDVTDVYLATRAAVYEGIKLELDNLYIPGMGTGVGNVKPPQAARAMMCAIHDIKNPKTYNSCAESFLDHQKFNF